MSASFERLFEILFKYRPFVFQKGRLSLASGSVATVAVVAVLVVAVALLSYWRIRGRMPRAERVLLMGLRAGALLLVALCLLRPTLVVSGVAPQQSFVAVLFDDSMSQSLADEDTVPRGEHVKKAFAEEGPLMQALRARFKLRTFRFSSRAERLDRMGDLRFVGRGTDLAAALQEVSGELRGVPLSGLVLVTDGADNAAAGLSETLLGLKARGVPVFTVGVGRERFDRDLDVGRVEAPRSVLQGTSFVAALRVAQRGYAGQRARLLVEDAGRVIHTQDVELPRDGGDEVVRAHVTVKDAGPRLLRFRVGPLEGERVVENNQQDVLVQVRDEREKILYFEGETRFEPAFIRRSVADDRNLQVVALLRTAKDKFLRLGLDDPEELAAGFPKTREELFRYRGLMLGSVEASAFTGDQLRMMADFVSERGGGLLVLGGAHALAEGGYGGTALAEALPVVLDPTVAPDGPSAFATVHVELTPAGAVHGATQLAATEDDSAKRWRTLPAVSTVNPIHRTRPGAATLLLGRPDGRGEPQVVLAHQRYGRGKAVALTIQDSWLWQMDAEIPVEDMTHETLWRQLLRWLVSGVDGPVAASAVDDRVSPGGSLVLRAEVRDETHVALNDAQVVAHVKAPSGEVHDVRMEWTLDKDGEYRASLPATEPGLYEARVDARRAGKELGSDMVFARVAELDTEFHEAEMRPALLRRIADETGGRFYPLDAAKGLPEDLTYSGAGAAVVERKDLWDMPVLFLALVGLISTEWGYRKWRGLA
jgi:uncharacterized membrane protein